MTKLLLTYGADVNRGTHFQMTPLFKAYHYKKIDIVRILLDCEACIIEDKWNDIRSLDSEKEIILAMIKEEVSNREEQWSPIRRAWCGAVMRAETLRVVELPSAAMATELVENTGTASAVGLARSPMI